MSLPQPTIASRIAWSDVALRYAAGLAVIAGALPLLSCAPAPLQDWPSHLARVWIIARMLAGDAFWNAHYTFGGFLIPNAILDVVVLGLLKLGVTLRLAGTLYLVLTYGVFVGGFRQLARAAGALSPLTLPLGAACFYGLPLFWGFVNFTTGVAVMLWAVAAWVDWRDRPLRRAVFGVAATLGTGFCHIVAAFLFVGVVGVLDLVAARGQRRFAWLLPPIPAALTALLLLLASRTAGTLHGSVRWRGGGSVLGFVTGKAALFAKALLSYQPGPDVLLGAALVTAAWLIWRLRARPSVTWAAVMGGLVLVAIVAPEWVGSGGLFDARIPAVAVIVLAATLSLRGAGPRLGLLLAGLLIGRSVWLAADWWRFNPMFAAIEAMLATLPPHSTLLASEATPIAKVPLGAWWSPAISNTASLAVTHDIFVPSVFAIADQQPLVLRPAWHEWSGYRAVDTPAQLGRVLAAARDRCPSPTTLFVLYPDAAILAAYPGTVPASLANRIAIIGAC